MKRIKLTIGKNKIIDVISIKEASEKILKVSGRMGANKFYSLSKNIGEMVNADTSKKIGFVSYNGKVWDTNNKNIFNPYQ